MLSPADSHWLRAGAYAVAAILAIRAAFSDESETDPTWQSIWIMSGCVLALFALGRAVDVGLSLTQTLHRRAVDEGWYDARREVQGVALVALSATCGAATALFGPGFRRRHPRAAPMVAVMVALVLYAVVRLVSLHDVDAVLHHRQLAGARVGSLIEWMLIGAAVGCSLGVARSGQSTTTADHAASTSNRG